MIVFALLIDFFMSSFTHFTTHLAIAAIPFIRSFVPVIIYFLVLSLYEPRYVINLSLFYILYMLNRQIDKHFRQTDLTYVLKIFIFCAIYMSLLYFIRNIF